MIQNAGAQRTIMMNQTGRVTNQINNQKILFVTQRPPTPSGNIQPSTQSQNTVVKFVSNTNTLNQQKIVTAQQKLGITHVSQGNQPPIAVVPKSNFQQNSNKMKTEQMQSQPGIDDLSHLV
jgi:hypothetical protein